MARLCPKKFSSGSTGALHDHTSKLPCSASSVSKLGLKKALTELAILKEVNAKAEAAKKEQERTNRALERALAQLAKLKATVSQNKKATDRKTPAELIQEDSSSEMEIIEEDGRKRRRPSSSDDQEEEEEDDEHEEEEEEDDDNEDEKESTPAAPKKATKSDLATPTNTKPIKPIIKTNKPKKDLKTKGQTEVKPTNSKQKKKL